MKKLEKDDLSVEDFIYLGKERFGKDNSEEMKKMEEINCMEIIKETTLLEKYNYFVVDFVASFLLRSCTEELKLNASILSRTRLTILK